MNDEVGWLIESPALARIFGRAAVYWSGGVSWTYDHLEAIRFARRVDAERAIAAGMRPDAIAVEHMWVGPAEGS